MIVEKYGKIIILALSSSLWACAGGAGHETRNVQSPEDSGKKGEIIAADMAHSTSNSTSNSSSGSTTHRVDEKFKTLEFYSEYVAQEHRLAKVEIVAKVAKANESQKLNMAENKQANTNVAIKVLSLTGSTEQASLNLSQQGIQRSRVDITANKSNGIAATYAQASFEFESSESNSCHNSQASLEELESEQLRRLAESGQLKFDGFYVKCETTTKLGRFWLKNSDNSCQTVSEILQAAEAQCASYCEGQDAGATCQLSTRPHQVAFGSRVSK